MRIHQSKLFIQMVDLEYEVERRERDKTMEFSREFTKKFSEIFLDDAIADLFNWK